ncbi:hypothetical protein Gorai_002723 [Gossypium raimondii]|uniref:DUF4283 domain-containing protein n=1 Tax=Gossypium raimondii TaxID=29730 RepID=A0A7J8QM04_GOSRA|nr:hypothetical protein [Gossypium raimondii]
MEEELANLNVINEEDVHFHEETLVNIMADLWHPIGGIFNLDLGEKSFCPIRVWIDPSKIIFGWDISLHAVVNRRTAVVSRWLLKSDRSIYKILDKEGGEHGRNIQDGGGMWSNWRDNKGKLYPNHNHIPLGPIIMPSTRDHKKHIVDCGLETRGVNVVGPMCLTSNGDEGPLMTMEGKKRQHLVGEPSLIFNEDKGRDLNEKSDSFVIQSTRMQ